MHKKQQAKSKGLHIALVFMIEKNVRGTNRYEAVVAFADGFGCMHCDGAIPILVHYGAVCGGLSIVAITASSCRAVVCFATL